MELQIMERLYQFFFTTRIELILVHRSVPFPIGYWLLCKMTRGIVNLEDFIFSGNLQLMLRLVDEETFSAISYRLAKQLVPQLVPLPHKYVHTKKYRYIRFYYYR
uniref:Uncharacterized protein n=2 Tax=Cacopsylla melanoneura TaxID=428564 RepID=A0A8D8SVJ2_9HEMI